MAAVGAGWATWFAILIYLRHVTWAGTIVLRSGVIAVLPALAAFRALGVVRARRPRFPTPRVGGGRHRWLLGFVGMGAQLVTLGLPLGAARVEPMGAARDAANRCLDRRLRGVFSVGVFQLLCGSDSAQPLRPARTEHMDGLVQPGPLSWPRCLGPVHLCFLPIVADARFLPNALQSRSGAALHHP